MTPVGEGKVVDILTLRQRVVVELPDVGRREFGKEEISVLDDLAPANPAVPVNIPATCNAPATDTPVQPQHQTSRPRGGTQKNFRKDFKKPNNPQ